MEIFLSDDESTVVVLDGDREEQHSLEEFVEIYGEGMLPDFSAEIAAKALEKEKIEKLQDYCWFFFSYLYAAGSYMHFLHLRQNVLEGVHPVQEVAYKYGYIDHLDDELNSRDWRRWRRLRELNTASQKVGYLPMDLTGMLKVMTFFENPDRLRYARDNVWRMLRNGECMSIADLMRKRYQVEKKNKDKAKKAAQ